MKDNLDDKPIHKKIRISAIIRKSLPAFLTGLTLGGSNSYVFTNEITDFSQIKRLERWGQTPQGNLKNHTYIFFKKKLIPPTEYTSLTQYCLNSMFIELKISGFVIIKNKNSVMIRKDDL